ncbi:hypothetical protein LUZ60_002463 [Juncus effusus]|nr:hypothetical protein LUZ60_002463 [Juncus effusus]
MHKSKSPITSYPRKELMAQEGSEASVTSSTNTNSWWQEMHHGSTTQQPVSWTRSAMNQWTQPPLPMSHQQCEHDDVSVSHAATSFASSGLTVDSASHAETHLWSQVLLSTGGADRNMHDQTQDDGENFLDLLNSKTLAPELFNLSAPCDYLKKMDTSNSSWGFNPLERHLNNYNPNPNPSEPGLNHLSDLVSNWSIAPPNPNLNIVAQPNMPCNSTMCNNYLDTNNISHIKNENANNSDSYGNNTTVNINEGGGNYQEFGSPVTSFLRSYQFGMNDNNPVLGLNNKLCSGLMEVPWSNNGARNHLSDLISFSGSPSKPLVDLKGLKSCVKSSDSVESNKKRSDSPARTSSRGSGTSGEGKKKRNEDGSESTQAKKSKQDSSTTSSPKQVQVPKVKMAEKITALQQIVSPFGKTDTASVLMEAINYIKFLHEQVQLLSDPYLKSGATTKDYNTWGGKENNSENTNPDLRNKGLCLVPISLTQVYRDSSVPDYWTPPYRSCLYR